MAIRQLANNFSMLVPMVRSLLAKITFLFKLSQGSFMSSVSTQSQALHQCRLGRVPTGKNLFGRLVLASPNRSFEADGFAAAQL